MKKIFKKNQVIITSLAILIAVAGYLNFADVDLGIGDKEASTDNSSILDQVEYDLSDETAVADENAETAAETAEVPDGSSTPGEAVLTGASDFAAQAKLSREQVRSQSKARYSLVVLLEESIRIGCFNNVLSSHGISSGEKQSGFPTKISRKSRRTFTFI